MERILRSQRVALLHALQPPPLCEYNIMVHGELKNGTDALRKALAKAVTQSHNESQFVCVDTIPDLKKAVASDLIQPKIPL